MKFDSILMKMHEFQRPSCSEKIQRVYEAFEDVNQLILADKLTYAMLLRSDFEYDGVVYLDPSHPDPKRALSATLDMLYDLSTKMNDRSAPCGRDSHPSLRSEGIAEEDDTQMLKLHAATGRRKKSKKKKDTVLDPCHPCYYLWSQVQGAMFGAEEGGLECAGIVWADGEDYFWEVFVSDEGTCPTCAFSHGMALLCDADIPSKC